jgi:hypothetical protein
MGAMNAQEKCVMVSNYDGEDAAVTLNLTGLGENETLCLRRLDDGKIWEEEMSLTASGSVTLKVKVPQRSALLVLAK